MPKTREGLYKVRPLLRLRARREGRCPKCGMPPERKKKPYRKYATGKIIVKAQCSNGHAWEMDYTPPPQDEVAALVCEDTSDGRVLTKVLTERGWRIVSARHGEHMLETGKARHFPSRRLAEEWLASGRPVEKDDV